LDQAFIKTLQDQGERLLEESIEGTIEKLQKEFKADVLQLDMYMERNRPKEWEELKEDWDKIYEEIAIEARIDLKIRRVGLTK
jgi:spore germination protein KC